MSSGQEEWDWFILKHVAENVRCVFCHRSYSVDELRILAHREGTWFIKVVCEQCGTEGLIMVMVQTHADQAFPRPTEDRERLALPPAQYDSNLHRRVVTKPITQEEIEELGRFLDNYRGNLTEFLLDD